MKNGLVVDPDGSKHWYVDGKRHRTDGPAVDRPDGSKYWYVNGKLHRTDGPAVMHTSGRNTWWVHGKQCVSPADYQNATNLTIERLIELVLLYGQIS